MRGSGHNDEGEIAAALDFADLLAIAPKSKICGANLCVRLAAIPVQFICPPLVSQPVTDEVCIAL